MDHDDNDEGQEDESPEEMVNRRLAEALDSQQRYMDMFQTSSHMLRMVSRFIADPIMIQDLEVVSDDDTRSSSPSSSTSSSSTPSSGNDTSRICIAAEWNEPAMSCRVVETRSNKVTLQGVQTDRRPLSCRNRTIPDHQLQQSHRYSAICSIPENDLGRQCEASKENTDEGRGPEPSKNDDALGAGDCQQAKTTTNIDDVSNHGHESSLQQHNRPRDESAIPNQTSCQTLCPGSKPNMATRNDDINTRGTNHQQQAVRTGIPIGVCTQAKINDTMVEISKAAETIRQARVMLSSFNQRMQMNNNHGEASNEDELQDYYSVQYGQTHFGKTEQVDKSSDTSVNCCEQGSDGVERSEATPNLESSGITQPIIVKPAADNDQVSNENHQTLQRCDPNAENDVSTSIHSPAAGDIVVGMTASVEHDFNGSYGVHGISTTTPNNQRSNLVVSRIGGSLGPSRTAWSHHFARLANSGNTASRIVTPNMPEDPSGCVSQSSTYNRSNPTYESRENTAVTNLQVKFANLHRFKTSNLPRKPHESGSSQVTLEAFQTALKLAVQNIEKDRTLLTTNGNTDTLSQTKVDSNNFILPIIDTYQLAKCSVPIACKHLSIQTSVTPVNHGFWGTCSGNAMGEDSITKKRNLQIKQDEDSPDDRNEGNIDTEYIICDCTSNTHSIPSTTLVVPFIDSSEDPDHDVKPVVTQEEKLYHFGNETSGEIIVVNDMSEPCSLTPVKDFEWEPPEVGNEGEKLTQTDGDVCRQGGRLSTKVANESDDVKRHKEKSGFLRRVSTTIIGWFKRNRETIN